MEERETEGSLDQYQFAPDVTSHKLVNCLIAVLEETDQDGGRGRVGEEEKYWERMDGKAYHGQLQKNNTVEGLHCHKSGFVTDGLITYVPRETLCHVHVSWQQDSKMLSNNRDPSLLSLKTTLPPCCRGIWIISSIIHMESSNKPALMKHPLFAFYICRH